MIATYARRGRPTVASCRALAGRRGTWATPTNGSGSDEWQVFAYGETSRRSSGHMGLGGPRQPFPPLGHAPRSGALGHP